MPKQEPLEPFIRPVNQTPAPAPAPKMEEPKAFVPRPMSQAPAPTPIIPVNIPVPTPTPEATAPEAANTVVQEPQVADDDQQSRVKNRMGRLKELSRRLRTASGLSELEDVPAYQRRAVSLEDVPHSSESQVSRYSLDGSQDDDSKKTGISNNNSFLHDNVD